MILNYEFIKKNNLLFFRISKFCEFPVFSIDYRLAPTHPYPHGVDDVWQSYNWLIDHCYEYFGIDPKHVIVTGDSAGGNLAISIAINAIKKNKRKPDGLFLFYPSDFFFLVLLLNLLCVFSYNFSFIFLLNFWNRLKFRYQEF